MSVSPTLPGAIRWQVEQPNSSKRWALRRCLSERWFSGNKRIQVFDNNGVFKTAFSNSGNAQAMCITKGANPVLYVSNSNPWNDIDIAGEIYRMRLDGTVLGKFGRAGRLLKEFGAVNSIDCRGENTLFVGELANLRVQKLVLH